jgi:hypothetical protein
MLLVIAIILINSSQERVSATLLVRRQTGGLGVSPTSFPSRSHIQHDHAQIRFLGDALVPPYLTINVDHKQ